MPTMEEYAKQTSEERLARAARTADDLASAIRGKDDAVMSRRPDMKNWAAKEVVCHLRDTEESFMARLDVIMAMDEPKLVGVNPDRWADERQYLRNDVVGALAAFRKRREETLVFLRGLKSEQWKRSGIHTTRGRMTVDDILSLIAWHDDNHLDQLKRALDGRV
jgi:uncharacterized damage-inducible protein DinB